MASSVTNCTIHHGQGWALNIYGANHIHFKDNIVYYFSTVGVSIASATNITFHNNVVGHVYPRDIEAFNYIDKKCGICIGSYFSDTPKVYDVSLVGNIVAGTRFSGYTSPGHDCGDDT